MFGRQPRLRDAFNVRTQYGFEPFTRIRRVPSERYYEPDFPVVKGDERAELEVICQETAERVAELFERRLKRVESAFDKTDLANRGWVFADITQYFYASVQRGARELLEQGGTLPERETPQWCGLDFLGRRSRRKQIIVSNQLFTGLWSASGQATIPERDLEKRVQQMSSIIRAVRTRSIEWNSDRGPLRSGSRWLRVSTLRAFDIAPTGGGCLSVDGIARAILL